MSAQREFMLFEVERTTGVDGRENVKAKRVVRECSVVRAAKLLEVSCETVRRYYKAGLIDGWQPGLALALQRDCKAPAKSKKSRTPNAKIVLDWESVSHFRESQRAAQRASLVY